MSAPLLSIVVPTHERAELLTRAIDSVLAQTLDQIELIVVDDASGPATAEVVRAYEDPRLIYVRLDRSGGAGAARNVGIRRARAPLVSFLDDDDELDPGYADAMVGAFAEAPQDTAFGWCGTSTVEDRPEGEVEVSSGTWTPRFPDRETAYLSVLRARRIGACGLTCRTVALREIGAFDERLRKAEDTELLIRLSRSYNFLVVRRTLLKIHKHAGANLTVYDGTMARAYEVIIDKNSETLDGHPGLATALHYKAGWLHYHGGNRREARTHMRRALERSPLTPKIWWAILMHELLGGAGPALHARLSRVRRAIRRHR